MLPRLIIGGALVASVFAPAASAQVELANLREDMRGLAQKVGELTLRVEQLENDNAKLRRQSAEGARSALTLAQLNDAVAELNRTIKSSVDNSQAETLKIVSTQLEKLGKQTNAALEYLAKNQGVRPVSTTSTSPAPASAATSSAMGPDDRPRDGATYTVQKGDSLSSIAKKLGVKQQDLATANKITDASVIKLGQVLVIPGAK